MFIEKKYSCGEINSLATNKPEEFVRKCEKNYSMRLDEAADLVIEKKNVKLIMLAGPSSSGKTTSAKLLADCFRQRGSRAYIVSLDNFYFGDKSKYPLDEFGQIDFETVHALDIPLIHDCFSMLLSKGLCEVPVYNFHNNKREDETEKILLRDNDVVIVEGLHALNPIITDVLPSGGLFKIYTSVSSRVFDDNGEVLMSKRDLRLVRRIVRDYHSRSSSVEDTLEMWPSVMRGEDNYLFPFENLSDIKINSFHPCEPCVLANLSKKLLDDVDKSSAFFVTASSMAQRMRCFAELDPSLLSRNSLLREFTG